MIRHFEGDLRSLERFYPIEWSEPRCARLAKFLSDEQKSLATMDMRTDVDGKIDLELLQNFLVARQDEITLIRAQNEELKSWLPFMQEAVELEEARAATKPHDPESSAKILQKVTNEARESAAAFAKAAQSGQGKPSIAVSRRAAARLDSLRRILAGWYKEFDGFTPSFSWWCKKPYEDLSGVLANYAKDLRQRGAGFVEGQDAPLIGDPIGRDALVRQMKTELLDMTPEQMLDRAEKEAVYCHDELKKASREMGFGDDWKKALAKVKEAHVEPGEQPAAITKIENEAIDFVTSRHLVTVEPVIRETWNWTMTSTQDEKTWPYPTYGFYKVMVPYATADMDEATKEQVFRGNGTHFLHLVVPHELIPGHHLQGLMASKYASYRELFSTPFLIEGWAMYWEMRLGELGWQQTPEDRIGMLFWRLHRCARVIVSTKFHLGQMKPDAMVDYLMNEVGHEPEMAKAEVRRYLAGDYSPLYQCAYLMGALALHDLHDEIVVKGRMSEQLFHDTILKQGSIPVKLIGAKLRSMLSRS
jgi:hypothetical protein